MAGPGRRHSAPDLDLADLEQAIYEGFVTSDSWHPVDQQCGLAVDDEQGDLPRTDMLDAISHTISAAIWFGLTTGYLTLTGRYTIPRKFLTHCHAPNCGWNRSLVRRVVR